MQQFNHGKEVLEKIDSSMKYLDNGNDAKAKETFEQGKILIQKRLKFIRIADRDDWITVQEYLSDDLASDSEDEKQLNKATRSASAKKENRKRKINA